MIVAMLGAGGAMGLRMARNLARAGHDVRAWNRTAQRARPLADDGATVAQTATDAVRDADVIVTMLTGADAVLGVMAGDDGALAAARDDALWLQMSTIGMDATQRCATLARERGVAFVDAPVLGTLQPAEAGELVVLASGPQEERERADVVFGVVGKRTLWVGEAGAGNRLKMVTNTWIVAVVQGAAEAVALAEGLGLDPQLLLDAVEGGGLDLPYLRMKAKAIIARDFTPTFALSLAAKDAGLVVEAAAAHGVTMPLAAASAQQMALVAREHGDEDIAATYYGSAPAADRSASGAAGPRAAALPGDDDQLAPVTDA